MKASHLPPRVDNSRPDSDFLPPTPTSLYNYKLSPVTPDTPPPLPPPHANLSASQQETWNRLNSNSSNAKLYYSQQQQQQQSNHQNNHIVEKSYHDFRLPLPSPIPRTGTSSITSRGLEKNFEQQHGLYKALTTQQNGYRQSAPSSYFSRQQQYEARGSLPSERYDRRSFVMPSDRHPQIPKVPSHQYALPPLDRYQIREQQSVALYQPHREPRIASLPELPQKVNSLLDNRECITKNLYQRTL